MFGIKYILKSPSLLKETNLYLFYNKMEATALHNVITVLINNVTFPC